MRSERIARATSDGEFTEDESTADVRMIRGRAAFQIEMSETSNRAQRIERDRRESKRRMVGSLQ